MKKTSQYFLILLCSVIFLSACKKDDNNAVEPENKQAVVIGDESYPLKYGYYVDLGFDGEESNIQLFLSEESADTDNCTACHILEIDLYSPKEEFAVGEFKINGELGVPNALVSFLSNSEGDSETLDISEISEIVEGTVKLSGVFPNYTVELDGSYEDGTKVKANFTGEFQEVAKPSEKEGLTQSSRKK